jgi:uncharacterized membrane protein
MKRAILIGLLLIIAGVSFKARAQSNVYTLCVGGRDGKSYSPIVQIGPWPQQFGIYRESYWTDPRGFVVSDIGNPRKPSDIHHVNTRVYLGNLSLSLPVPPAIVATLIAGALMAVIAFIAGLYARKRASPE